MIHSPSKQRQGQEEVEVKGRFRPHLAGVIQLSGDRGAVLMVAAGQALEAKGLVGAFSVGALQRHRHRHLDRSGVAHSEAEEVRSE